jgi:hypothetical protein
MKRRFVSCLPFFMLVVATAASAAEPLAEQVTTFYDLSDTVTVSGPRKSSTSTAPDFAYLTPGGAVSHRRLTRKGATAYVHSPPLAVFRSCLSSRATHPPLNCSTSNKPTRSFSGSFLYSSLYPTGTEIPDQVILS